MKNKACLGGKFQSVKSFGATLQQANEKPKGKRMTGDANKAEGFFADVLE